MQQVTTHTAPLIHNGLHFLNNNATIVLNQNNLVVDIIKEPLSNTIYHQGLLCPAFINAHCHTELSFMHNKIPKGTGLPNFLMHVNSVRNSFDKVEQQNFIAPTLTQMYQNGIIAVGDICNGAISFAAKENSPLKFYNFLECVGIDDASAYDRVEYLKKLLLSNATVVPHAPYSVSKTMFQLINALQPQGIISIHNQECKQEDDLVRNGIGELVNLFKENIFKAFAPLPNNCSSVQYAINSMQKAKQILLVHNTYTTKQDAAWAEQQDKNIFWVTCPNANLYIENTLPTIYDYWIANNAKVCIGTDSLASNDALSIYDEIYTLFKAKKIEPEILLKWATFNGAQALKMEEVIGSITIGKQAKIINIKNWEQKNTMEPNATISWL